MAINLASIIPKTELSTKTTPQVQAILDGVIELRNQNIDLVEIQGTVEEVTTDKARRVAEAVSSILSILKTGGSSELIVISRDRSMAPS